MPDTTPQRKAPKRNRAKATTKAKASTTAKRKASTTRKPATAAKRKAGATAKRKASTTRKPATAAKRKAGTKAKRKAGTKAAAKPAASATAGAAGASRAGGGRRGRGRSTGLPRELLKSFEDGQRAASDAVRKFLETVEEALPLRGNNAPTASTATTGPTASVNAAIAAQVPATIKAKGTLTVGTEAQYAPNEFIAPDGHTVIGMDPDLVKALAAVMGLNVKLVNTTFE